jgi:DNA primase
VNAQEIKDKVGILEALEFVGARFGWQRLRAYNDEVPVFCPFCEDRDSHNPAGRANVVKDLYHCWNCGFGGDQISVVQKELNGLSFSETLGVIERELVEDGR